MLEGKSLVVMILMLRLYMFCNTTTTISISGYLLINNPNHATLLVAVQPLEQLGLADELWLR